MLLSLGLLFLTASVASAATTAPTLSLNLAAGQTEPENVSILLEILFMMTVLSLAPAIMLMMTSFTRIIIVFSFLRQAMGTAQMPPTQILASLAIFMTFVIMYPVGKQINDQALQPYLAERMGFTEALHTAEQPLRGYQIGRAHV